MSERAKFVLAAEEGLFSMTELCQRYGISRKTGYRWRGRYHEGGLEALNDQSRAPKTIPHQTPEPVEEALVALRRKHPSWGVRKRLVLLRRREPELADRYGLPAASTVTGILHRHGLSEPKRPRRKHRHPRSTPRPRRPVRSGPPTSKARSC